MKLSRNMVLGGMLFIGFGLRVASAAESWPGQAFTLSPEALKTESIATATARAGALPPHIDAPAYVALDERRVARIHPVGQGRVQTVRVVPGQLVHRGDVLFTYDNFTLSDERQDLMRAEAALQQARALRDDAMLAYRRAQALQGGAVSVGEMQRRRSRMMDAEGSVRQHEASLRNERAHLARYSSNAERTDGIRSEVISPIDGVVRHIAATAGEELAGRNMASVEIDDLTQVWVISQVDEQQASRLARGGKQLTWASPDDPPVESKIDIIEGSVDPTTRHVLVRSLLANASERFRPDMLVKTRLFMAHNVSGVVVPEAALQTIGSQPCVFVHVDADRYEARRVEVGPSLDGEVVLLKGVRDGENVVTEGSFVLKSQAILAPTPDHSENGR